MTKPSMEDLLMGRSRNTAEREATHLDPPAEPVGQFPMKYLIGGAFILVIILSYLVYGFYGLQEEQKSLVAELKEATEQARAEREQLKIRSSVNEASISDLKADTGVIRQKVGVTQSDLNRARAQVARLKEEQNQNVAQIRATLATKAETRQLAALKQTADEKFGKFDENIGAVKTDVAGTKKDLGETQRLLIDVRDTLNSQIATNKKELAILRRMGQRDYYEFSTTKNRIIAVHDIRLKLRKTRHKKAEYDLNIYVDDQVLQKKHRAANEPVQFLVGKDKVRYEIVVNTVAKNRIEGYLSVPKDKALSAERPTGK